MNAVLPYEPWHLDNTNKSFLPINISGYYIQFFAPTSGYYTNMKLYADISNSEFYSGTIGVAIYKNNPVDETGPPINQQTPGVPVNNPIDYGKASFSSEDFRNRYIDISFNNPIDLSINELYWATIGVC